MSGANGLLPDITLDELARLIRLLGMLGSASDGEVLAAARFAVKWVREHGTDWETLLVPEPEPAVLSVATVADEDAQAAAIEAAYQDGLTTGIKRGMEAMAAQVKAAQAAMASHAQRHQTAQAMWTTMTGTGLGSPLGGLSAAAALGQGPAAPNAPGGPVRPPGGPPGASHTGTWQSVCQALLDRDAQGIPGIFRGSREQDFVSSLLTRGYPSLTPAQDTWLRDIARRNGMSW